jgi:hypothetical protein
MAAAGLGYRLHAPQSAVSRAHPNPAISIEQKNNQTVFKEGVYRMKSQKCGQRASEISQILEIELFS